jgi:predicted short-subunit dehydrogenase-like oxidoreductase (DUF2520 family)
MASAFAVFGPGRVGVALARRFAAAGFECLGFVGRDASRIAQAAARCRARSARSLERAEVARATFVVLAVSDPALREVVAGVASTSAARRCSLWFHTSGLHDLAPLAPLADAGCRIGILHPVTPVPAPVDDAGPGPDDPMRGRAALLSGDPNARRLLRVLARKAGFVGVEDPGVDRVRYHAACALAANGLTALAGVVARLFAELGLPPLHRDLMQSALRMIDRLGETDAMTGPVVRGDAATVGAHLDAFAAGCNDGAALALYRALAAAACERLVHDGRLSNDDAATITATLARATRTRHDPPPHG